MDFRKEIDTIIMLRNNSPLEELQGLSPNQFHSLLYETLEENSPVKFRDKIKNETLDKISLFRIAEEYLKIVAREKEIKLTPLGALPRKVMLEIYDKGFLPDELIESGISKLAREQDCISIMSARFTVEIAGLTKKVKGKINLTKNGEKLIKQENRVQLFKLFFKTFTDDFSWSHNDGYPDAPIGQFGWAFSAYMLNKFGDKEQTVDFYSLKYLKALPNLLEIFSDEFDEKEKYFTRCYNVRVIKRFLLWFGMVKINKKEGARYFDEVKIIGTNILKEVFKFDD